MPAAAGGLRTLAVACSPAAGGPLESSGSACHIEASRPRRRALGPKTAKKWVRGRRHATADCRLQFGHNPHEEFAAADSLLLTSKGILEVGPGGDVGGGSA